MIEQELINEMSNALDIYRHVIAGENDANSKEDYWRLVAIAERVIAASQDDDMTTLKLSVLGFSRQVSDSFAIQPPEFKALAYKIAEIKRRVI